MIRQFAYIAFFCLVAPVFGDSQFGRLHTNGSIHYTKVLGDGNESSSVVGASGQAKFWKFGTFVGSPPTHFYATNQIPFSPDGSGGWISEPTQTISENIPLGANQFSGDSKLSVALNAWIAGDGVDIAAWNALADKDLNDDGVINNADFELFIEDEEEPPSEEDPDNDGYPNWKEMQLGSDPNDPDDVPKIDGWKFKVQPTTTMYDMNGDGNDESVMYYELEHDDGRVVRYAQWLDDEGKGGEEWSLYSEDRPGASIVDRGTGFYLGVAGPTIEGHQYGKQISDWGYQGPITDKTGTKPNSYGARNSSGDGNNFGGPRPPVEYVPPSNRDGGNEDSDAEATRNDRDARNGTDYTDIDPNERLRKTLKQGFDQLYDGQQLTAQSVEALRKTIQSIGDDLYQAEKETGEEVRRVGAEIRRLQDFLNNIGRQGEDIETAIDDLRLEERQNTDRIVNALGDLESGVPLPEPGDPIESNTGGNGQIDATEQQVATAAGQLEGKLDYGLGVLRPEGSNALTFGIPFNIPGHGSFTMTVPLMPDTSTPAGVVVDTLRMLVRALMSLLFFCAFIHRVILTLRQY